MAWNLISLPIPVVCSSESLFISHDYLSLGDSSEIYEAAIKTCSRYITEFHENTFHPFTKPVLCKNRDEYVHRYFQKQNSIQPRLQGTFFYIWYHRFISRISCSQNFPSASLSSFMRLNLTITSEEPPFETCCGVPRILRVTFSTSVVHAPLKVK